jgi:hypothetical protein
MSLREPVYWSKFTSLYVTIQIKESLHVNKFPGCGELFCRTIGLNPHS